MSSRKPGEPKDPFAELSVASGETHQVASSPEETLTTNQGVAIADDQNSLRIGSRGPILLEDFILREKITHFDHERIPERVVHARGFGAKGYFRPHPDAHRVCKAGFLKDPATTTPVFVRFSTVAGSEGSADCARDVRGFAVKFYTQEGNFDLVGNNIPVFFIQDAMKFPDLIHSVKPEPDRGFPQAQSAHDTFWDFVSLNPESTHMLLWIMSDRAIPRSYRMMEGFGVHTFRMQTSEGVWNFVKFHFRPKLGMSALLWDEAVSLNGADPDFHRRDLWTAIEQKQYPSWELGVQVFDEETAAGFEFDVLDPTKLVPEELVPITPLGEMVLDENVSDFFAETDQVAFCPSHLVPGIDFSEDPLLQGRLFSYLDTQLSRLGSPNFHEIPVNKPRCPIRNLQRGGHMRMEVGKGRYAYEANSYDGPRENPDCGFQTLRRETAGMLLRTRGERFADHFRQATLFWLSMSAPEQQHIVAAFNFELSKVQDHEIRIRMLENLRSVHSQLANRVAEALGLEGKGPPEELSPTLPDIGKLSPSLSMLAKAPKTVEGRKLGVVVLEGANGSLLGRLCQIMTNDKAFVELVTPHICGVQLDDGSMAAGDHTLEGGPSVLFDYVAIFSPPELPEAMEQVVRSWVEIAHKHKKPIAVSGPSSSSLLPEKSQAGVLTLSHASDLDLFVEQCRKGRVWDRNV